MFHDQSLTAWSKASWSFDYAFHAPEIWTTPNVAPPQWFHALLILNSLSSLFLWSIQTGFRRRPYYANVSLELIRLPLQDRVETLWFRQAACFSNFVSISLFHFGEICVRLKFTSCFSISRHYTLCLKATSFCYTLTSSHRKQFCSFLRL